MEWLYHIGVPENEIEDLAEHSANTVPVFPAAKIKNIGLVYKGGEVDIAHIKEILSENGIVMRDMNFCNSYEEDLLEITILVNTPGARDLKKLAQELKQTGALKKFSFY